MGAEQTSRVAALRRVLAPDGHRYAMLWFWCPGCDEAHAVTVQADEGHVGPRWQWNGDIEAPGVEPSINCNPDHADVRCHSFLRNGVMEFLDDCGHKLRGKHALAELPEWLKD
jgi:hypothetical protein